MNYFFAALLSLVCIAPAQAEEWFRNKEEWVSNRSVRPGLATEPTTKVVSNGAKYDATIGKRIPLLTLLHSNDEYKTWFIGIDGGMLASLHREKKAGTPVFGTESFDGFFGVFTAYSVKGYLAMLRWGHLSAHLVDDAPNIFSTLQYSHFFSELTLGKTWPEPSKVSRWDLHTQATVGMNYIATPAKKNPRRRFGLSGGFVPGKNPNALGVIASVDLNNSGVIGQKNNYNAFFGFGYLNRPQSTHRPLRFGVTHYWGSDYRNQYYARPSKFTALEVQIEM